MASSSDAFPAGLRVLVVDHDSACLNTLQKMLIKCNYQVSTCSLAQEALDLLENRRDGFDIVMSDVDVLDMDGFKFLEQVGLKMDLPVIMMSVDGETSRVMKGVQHGACDYLLKPIRMKELRNIWQHVFRKRMRQVSSVEAKESVEESLKSDDSSTFSGDMAITCKKRKDFDQKSIESIDPSSMKKARVVWTSELHSKFLMAVDHIGLDKVGPKKILDLMGVPWLTRENVASHLQKYRLNLSRMQKENGMKLSRMQKENGMKLPNSVTLHQNIVINENYASAAGQQIHIHGQVGGILSMPLQAEGEKPLFGDFLHPEMNSNSRIGFDQPFELLKAESKIQAHYTSSSLIKSHFQPGHRFDQFPLVTHNQGQSRREVYQDQNQAMKANTNHFYNKNKSYAIGTDHHHTLLSFPDQGYLTHCHNSINHDEEQNLQNNLESSLKNMIIVGTGTTSLRLRDVELNPYANDMYLQNTQHVNLESFGGSSKEEKIVATDAQLELYEAHNFEYEKNNGVECYARDQDLYFR